MIGYVRGTVAEKSPARAVIDVHGVGYEFAISLSTYEALPPPGKEAKLLTRTYVREDTIQLFGFATSEEMELFRYLLIVPGIGPKLALAVLSGVTPDRFRAAVRAGDAKLLARTPGIGKKTAERLIVELKGKFDDDIAVSGGAGSDAGGVAHEAMLALEALGVRADKASAAIERVLAKRGGDATVEELVREALNVI